MRFFRKEKEADEKNGRKMKFGLSADYQAVNKIQRDKQGHILRDSYAFRLQKGSFWPLIAALLERERTDIGR